MTAPWQTASSWFLAGRIRKLNHLAASCGVLRPSPQPIACTGEWIGHYLLHPLEGFESITAIQCPDSLRTNITRRQGNLHGLLNTRAKRQALLAKVWTRFFDILRRHEPSSAQGRNCCSLGAFHNRGVMYALEPRSYLPSREQVRHCSRRRTPHPSSCTVPQHLHTPAVGQPLHRWQLPPSSVRI